MNWIIKESVSGNPAVWTPPAGFSVGSVEITFYGIIIALAIVASVIIADRLGKKYRNVSSDDVFFVAWFTVGFGVLGARLFYIFTFIDIYIASPQLIFTQFAGLSIYGGIVGGFAGLCLGVFLGNKIKQRKGQNGKIDLVAVLDIAAPVVVMSQAIGRWGNFFNQELYGREITNANAQWFPWAVYINWNANHAEAWHHALFFYESFLNIIVFAVLIFLIKRVKAPGLIVSLYVAAYGVIRIILEGFREPEGTPVLFGAFNVWHMFSLLFIVVGLTFTSIWLYRNKDILKKRRRKKEPKKV